MRSKTKISHQQLKVTRSLPTSLLSPLFPVGRDIQDLDTFINSYNKAANFAHGFSVINKIFIFFNYCASNLFKFPKKLFI